GGQEHRRLAYDGFDIRAIDMNYCRAKIEKYRDIACTRYIKTCLHSARRKCCGRLQRVSSGEDRIGLLDNCTPSRIEELLLARPPHPDKGMLSSIVDQHDRRSRATQRRNDDAIKIYTRARQYGANLLAIEIFPNHTDRLRAHPKPRGNDEKVA